MAPGAPAGRRRASGRLRPVRSKGCPPLRRRSADRGRIPPARPCWQSSPEGRYCADDVGGERRDHAHGNGGVQPARPRGVRGAPRQRREIVPVRAALEGTVYRGPEAAEQYCAAVDESWENLRWEVEEIRMATVGSLPGSHSGPRTWQRCGHRHHAGWLAHYAGKADYPLPRIRQPCRGPRSRRASGVGDVAGERGGRPTDLRRAQSRDDWKGGI